MLGTITIDYQDRTVICNATRNRPYAHRRRIFKLSQFGDILAFVSNMSDRIGDETLEWETD